MKHFVNKDKSCQNLTSARFILALFLCILVSIFKKLAKQIYTINLMKPYEDIKFI